MTRNASEEEVALNISYVEWLEIHLLSVIRIDYSLQICCNRDRH